MTKKPAPTQPKYMSIYHARIAFAELLGWDSELVREVTILPGYVTVMDVHGDTWRMDTKNMQTSEWYAL